MKLWINLVVPSKIAGGSEVESRAGGRTSCPLLQENKNITKEFKYKIKLNSSKFKQQQQKNPIKPTMKNSREYSLINLWFIFLAQIYPENKRENRVYPVAIADANTTTLRLLPEWLYCACKQEKDLLSFKVWLLNNLDDGFEERERFLEDEAVA